MTERKSYTEVTAPKSIAYTNFATGAYTGERRRKRPPAA